MFKNKKRQIVKKAFIFGVCIVMMLIGSNAVFAGTAVKSNIPPDILKKNQLNTTTPLNTKVNLFDYWVHDSAVANDWINQGQLNPAYSSHTMGINKGRPLLVGNGMGNYGNNYYYGLWNTTASSWQRNNLSWMEGIVANRLGADGMPQLNVEVGKDSDSNGIPDVVENKNLSQKVYDAWNKDLSLAYLFDPSAKIDGRAAYKNVRNLFSLDGGNYSFHSSKNYAQFINDESISGSDGYFNVYNAWAVQNGSHAGGNFAPFNTAQQVLKKTHTGGLQNSVNSCIQNQGNNENMKPEATSAGTTAADTTINHYLGMTMETSFIQPDGGLVKGGGSDEGVPMVFKFTGDNDVWIYIDDVLVGDLGGVHSESFIAFDFSTGYIYRGPVKKDGSIPSLEELGEIFAGQGDSQQEKTITLTEGDIFNQYQDNKRGVLTFSRTTIRAMHEAAGDDTQQWSGKTNENSYTYGDQTVHTLKFFYLERGGYDTNLSLDFNLVSVPYSSIFKIDQDNDPVEGAGFELYAANYDENTGNTTIDNNYNNGKPICTAKTDESGRLMFVDDRRRIIQFDELAANEVTAYILKETEVPLGYRGREDIYLYYENGLVFSRDYLKTGAYTTGILNVTMDKTLYNLDNPTDILVEDTSNMDGMLFAVPLKLDTKYIGEFDKDDSTLGAKLHPVYGNSAGGWHVMAEGADLLKSQEDKMAIVTAAKNYDAVAIKNNRDLYSMTLDKMPGDVKKQYWYVYTSGVAKGLTGDDLKAYVKENTEYIMAFYYTPDANSLEALDADDNIYRIVDTNFEKKFSSEMHIPNNFNRFRVQKMDYHGDWVAGAKFGLYQLYSEYDRDGDGDQYLKVSVLDKTYYMNTQLFDLTDAELRAIKEAASTDKPYDVMKKGSDGKSINDKQKTHAQIKEDWDKGEADRKITPWDVTTTKANNRLQNLDLNGTAMFPSAYEDWIQGEKDPYDVNDTRTYIEKGYYVMYELEAPKNHVINTNPVPVEVTNKSIYANAGDFEDGIRVGMYVGWPRGTVSYFAAEDAIDGTLTYLDAKLKVVRGLPPLDEDSTSTGLKHENIQEGETTYHYKFDNRMKYYQRMYEENDTTIYMKSARNLYLFTGEGHPVLEIYQDNEKDRYALSFKRDYQFHEKNPDKIGKLRVVKEDENGHQSQVVVNVTEGMACYRLKAGQKAVAYFFTEYDRDGNKLTEEKQIFEEIPGSDTHDDKDFVINQPNVDDCGERDISNLFSVSTLVQVYDRDHGDLTVKTEVEKDTGSDSAQNITEARPFYCRLYALYENVTEIQLFKKDGDRGKSDFSGHLNVRIGAANASAADAVTGDYDESSVRNISVEFKNGVGKVWLSGGYSIKKVYLPQNQDHEASNLTAFISNKIKLTGENENYTGKLYVSAKDAAIGTAKRTHLIDFVNGEALYYAANSTIITGVSAGVDKTGYGPAGKNFDFTATEHWSTATANEIIDENPVRKLKVSFIDKDGNSSSKDKIVTDGMTDVSQDDGNYYLNMADNKDSNPFLGDMAVVGDFALYDGQSIHIQDIPCGITYYVQEWSLDESPNDKKYDDSNTAVQKLVDTYTVGAETTYTEEFDDDTMQSEHEDAKNQFEYVQEHRTAKSLIRADIHRTIIFKNTAPVGSLTVGKTVKGDDSGQVFNFAVTLTDSDGTPIAKEDVVGVKTTNGENPETVNLKTDENGVVNIELKSGEQLKLSGLTKGTKYKVEETGVKQTGTDNRQLIDYLTMVSDGKDGGETTANEIRGVISANTNHEALFTNTFKGNLTISKQLRSDGNDYNKKFTFRIRVKADDGTPLTGQYEYTGATVAGVNGATAPQGGTLTFEEKTENGDSFGEATVELSHGQAINLRLPVGATYEVEETAVEVNGGENGNVTLNQKYKTEVTGDDGKAVASTKATGQIDADGNRAAFANTLKGGLTISKMVSSDGSDSQQKFKFRIIAKATGEVHQRDPKVPYKGNVVAGVSGVTAPQDGTLKFITKKDENGKYFGEAFIELSHGQAISFTLGVGVDYTVEEVGVVSGGDKELSDYITTVKTGDVEEVGNEAEGKIKGTLAPEVRFTNTLKGSLQISKKVTAEPGYIAPNDEFNFDITLKKGENGVSGKFPYTINNAGNEKKTGTIEFDENGKITAITPESAGQDAGDGAQKIKLKAGDTLKIDNIPVETVYTVTEEKKPGWTANATAADPTPVNNIAPQTVGTANLDPGEDGKAAVSGTIRFGKDGNVKDTISNAVFTNTYKPEQGSFEFTPKSGARITKQLTGRALRAGEFDFAMKALNEDGNEAGFVDGMTLPEDLTVSNDGDGNVNFGTLTFTKAGAYKVKISEVIPAETDDSRLPNVTYDDHEVIYTFNVTEADGKLAVGEPTITGDKVFKNVYETSLDYDGVDNDAGIQIRKTLSGRSLEKDMFSFELQANNEKSAKKAGIFDEQKTDWIKTLTNGTPNIDGTAVMRPFANDMTFNQEDAGKSFSYTVREVIPEQKAAGYKYDTKVYHIEIRVRDDGNGVLTVATFVNGMQQAEYASNSQTKPQPVTLEFNNSYEPKPVTLGGSGTVKINATKTLTNRDMTEGMFKFVVKAIKGDDVTEEVVATGTNGAANKNEKADIGFEAIEYSIDKLNEDVKNYIAVKSEADDGTVTYRYRYFVSEEEKAGYTPVQSSFIIEVNIVDDGSGELKVRVDYPEPAAGENGNSIDFVNTYVIGSSVNTTPVGIKNISAEGFAPPEFATVKDRYSFVLTAEDGAPLPENAKGGKAEAAFDDVGQIDFGRITYTADDMEGAQPVEGSEGVLQKTFRYKVVEKLVDGKEAAAGLSMDEGKKTFEVVVQDDGEGNLSVANQPENLWFAFTNEYTAEEVISSPTGNGNLTISKELTGRELRAEEFEFAMTAAENYGDSVVPQKLTAKNTENGSVEFGDITFKKPRTYKFNISEVDNDIGGITYDSRIYTAVAEVTDRGVGELEIEWSIENAQNADGQGGEIAGNAEAKKTVIFRNSYKIESASIRLGALKILDGKAMSGGEFEFVLEDEDGKIVCEAKNGADGSVRFKSMSFDEAGTYQYKVYEKKGRLDGVVYDETVHDITVEVIDDGSGRLKAEINGAEELVFRNAYDVEAAAKTGDDMNIALLMLLMIISTAGAAAAVYVGSRKVRR